MNGVIKKITLICAAGMSTSMLVVKMRLAAAEMKKDVEIRAVAESDFKKVENDTDILLLGPQVGFMINKFKENYERKGIKVEIIDSNDYGRMDGERVLKKALAM